MTNPPTMQDLPVSPERARRILSIAADLLPPEIMENRRAGTARRMVLLGLAGFLVLLGGWYGAAVYQTSTARDGLAAAEDHVSRLQAQQNRYADVVSAQAQSKAISAALAGLLADDLQWSSLLSAMRGVAPAGVTVTGLAGALDQGTNGGAAGSTVQLPDGSGRKLIGKVDITGTAGNKAEVAAYVDALGTVHGLTGALVTNTTVENDAVKFSVRVDITDLALGGRYTPRTSTGSGVK